MLEEAVNSDQYSPSETALALLSFIQMDLPAGGAESEKRFIRLYLPLCDRIFGKILLDHNNNSSNSATNNNNNNKKDMYRHDENGWLSAPTPWNRYSTYSSQQHHPSSPARSNSSGSLYHPNLRSGGLVGGVSSTAAAQRNMNTSSSSSYEYDPVYRLLAPPEPPSMKGNKSHSPMNWHGGSAGRLVGGGTIAGSGGAGGEVLVMPTTLIEAISKESENLPNLGWMFPFLGLPKSMQDVWMTLIDDTTFGNNNNNNTNHRTEMNSNMNGNATTTPYSSSRYEDFATTTTSLYYTNPSDVRLLGVLIRRRPEDQRDLYRYRQHTARKDEYHRTPLQISPRGITNVMTSSSSSPTAKAFSSFSPNQQQQYAKENDEAWVPQIMLSTLEHYLFLYIRFPLYAPTTRSNASSTHMNNSSNTKESYGDVLYYQIFRRMLRHFLPYEREEERWIVFDPSTTTSTRESELFARIMIAFWFNAFVLITPTELLITSYQERTNNSNTIRRSGPIIDSSTTSLLLDLDQSYDLVRAQYESPPILVQNCIRSVITRIMADPNLQASAQHDKYSGQQQQQHHQHRPWCLSSAITTFQQPFYNYVRTTFRYASIHHYNSPFFTALNTWLCWLEPWNVQVTAKSNSHDFSPKHATQRMIGSTSSPSSSSSSSNHENGTYAPRTLLFPRYHQPSRYQSSWEPFIVANLFMYAVPLAIFLRRARELDFSSKKFDSSLQLVQRVFRVFTPEVIHVISSHLNIETSSSLSNGTTIPMSHRWVARHREILGPYSPPVNNMSLASLGDDMRTLMDEIQSQHWKKVRELDIFERAVGNLEGLFGQGVISREERTLLNVFERARLIAGLPMDYTIRLVPDTKMQNPKIAATLSTATLERPQVPERDANGFLTDRGRHQLLHGEVKCSPLEISYIGDRMHSTVVGTYEVAWLVTCTVSLSDWLNSKLGFVVDHINPDGSKKTTPLTWFRINLRFLADYRNLLVTIVFIMGMFGSFVLLWWLWKY